MPDWRLWCGRGLGTKGFRRLDVRRCPVLGMEAGRGLGVSGKAVSDFAVKAAYKPYKARCRGRVLP